MFDATSVSDIANASDVYKALIYYYFKSKEDILDYMEHSLLNNAISITMDFNQTNIVQMIKNGDLAIKPARLHFAHDEAINQFLQNSQKFYAQVVANALKNRHIIRILLLESLKSGKDQNSLFMLMDFVGGTEENPIFKSIAEADQDFAYSDEIVLFNLFFSFIPVLSFAAYFDDYKALSNLSDDLLKRAFLRVSQILATSMFSGKDILLRNDIASV